MLPLGLVGMAFGHEHPSGLTKPEQVTMMTLWSIFRSPMMLGCELTKMDEWTVSLVTNAEVMRLLQKSSGAHQLFRNSDKAVWVSNDTEDGSKYIALFNLSDNDMAVSTLLDSEVIRAAEDYELGTCINSAKAKELWTGKEYNGIMAAGNEQIAAHGAGLYKLQ